MAIPTKSSPNRARPKAKIARKAANTTLPPQPRLPAPLDQIKNDPASLEPRQLLQLQRMVGNQTLQRMLPAKSPTTARTGPRIQRHVFINERQLKEQPATTSFLCCTTPRYFYYADDNSHAAEDGDLSEKMEQMLADKVVRNYNSLDEFAKHANKQTDYLGNLADGTWVRFSPTGLNILGESHTRITLDQVVPAVGSQNFIYEPFSSDDLADGSNIQSTYEAENQDKFAKFGVQDEPNKKQFGAESLFPKMGYGLTSALPYFRGDKGMDGLVAPNYSGQPYQRYLKIAWAYAKDVRQAQKGGQVLSSRMENLADVFEHVVADLDGFITPLAIDGYLGDAFYLEKPDALLGGGKPNLKAMSLLPALAAFAEAFSEAMLEMAANEEPDRLKGEFSALQKAQGKGNDAVTKAQFDVFAKWRNLKFTDNVVAAALKGVRYAGMGNNHLIYLTQQGILTDKMHPFNMTDTGPAIQGFKATTEKLRKAAR